MDANGGKEEVKGNFPRKFGARSYGGGLKSSFSGRSSPRELPPLRRLHSERAPRRDPGAFASEFRWIRSNRVLLWLLLIALWAYVGFHVQSRWAHSDHRRRELVSSNENSDKTDSPKKPRDFVAAGANASEEVVVAERKDLKSGTSSGEKQSGKSKGNRRSRHRRKKPNAKPKVAVSTSELEVDMMNTKNGSYGLIVGPFGGIEDEVLEWSAEKRRGTCDRKGEFARIVWARSFVLVFHELSMTGAPLSMMELATEILSCGGSVTAVVVSRKGGLITELDRRGIKVLDDSAQLSFKTAMKSDLVIAGSAVCSSWIEQYLAHNSAGSSHIVWWIMENRREYFERSKNLLSQVKMLTFLSQSQAEQWQSWCEEEKIHLKMAPTVVPLSVNDELAFVAGIPCSLNTPSFSTEKMLEKRNLLRAAVRKAIGISDSDMLMLSLSSINPPKGQRLFLESAIAVVNRNVSLEGFEMNYTSIADTILEVTKRNENMVKVELNSGDESSKSNRTNVQAVKATKAKPKKRQRKHSKLSDVLSSGNRTSKGGVRGDGVTLRKLLSVNETREQTLKVLIGSLGSKSNKAPYIQAMLEMISQHTNMSSVIFWTPATTCVASLYAAADVYVINAQGLGETFGRVTVEAMAFGLPVLGTEAGGTKEIVEHKVTGLLHPIGQEGVDVLARNILYLMKNPSVRKKMGELGRQKAISKYLKSHMYESLAKVMTKCMKIK